MNVTIGLDIGGSTTKVVGFEGKRLLQHCLVRASDPVASAYGGVGKFLSMNQLQLSDVRRIQMTGVGSSYINNTILDIPTFTVDEFESVGLGGLYLSHEQQAVVVSMGTGTSMVYAGPGGSQHIIGSGIGGGTLIGLSQAMVHTRDFETIGELAQRGDLKHVDLTIGDITQADIPGLDAEVTASNFGKLSDQAEQADLTLGIVNLVFQSVGTSAVLAARLQKLKKIVFVGSLVTLEEGKACLKKFADLYDVEIIIPKCAEFCTAIGAALCTLPD